MKIVNLPIKARKGRKLVYPWPSMKVGDTFFKLVKTGQNLLTPAKSWSRINTKGRVEFTTWKTGKGYTIQRIK